MILFTLFCLLSSPTETSMEIQGPFLKPRVHWADLNSDGQQDIWIRDVTDEIWVKDDADSNAPFQKLVYERLNGREQPLWQDDQWVVGTFYEESYLTYHPQSGWQIALDYSKLGPYREGLSPKVTGTQTLVPALDGYWLTEGDCIQQRFKILPAINLKGSQLRITYPVLQWRDLDGDKIPDLFAPPVSYRQQGTMGIWTAIRQGSQWTEKTAKLQLSPELEIQQFQLGDINGDQFQDLVVIARPSKDMSVFEELSFLVYLASDHGVWEPVASQTLKTRQNLWQTGPIEVNQDGIFIYYFKGLIRSKFKIDRYVWNDGGYIQPKPISARWKVPDADREFILLNYDFNGDGLKDLLLEGDDGLQIHYREKISGKKGLPFSQSNKALFSNQRFAMGNQSITINIGGDGAEFVQGQSALRHSVRREKRAALIRDGENYKFWHFEIDNYGAMKLHSQLATIK